MTEPSRLDFKLDKKGSVPCLVWNAKDDVGQSAGRPASDIEVALFGEIEWLKGALSESVDSRKRMEGLLREMKKAMLGYPMSTRAFTSSALLAAINSELREGETP